MSRKLSTTLSLLLGLGFASSLFAQTPISGTIGFAGIISPDVGSDLSDTTLFSVSSSTVIPGSDTGNLFSPDSISVSGFSFSPFIPSSSPIWTIENAGASNDNSFMFVLESLEIVSQGHDAGGDPFLFLSGRGTVEQTAPGSTVFSPTPFEWSLNASSVSNAGFSINVFSEVSLPTVPEPSSLAGLLLVFGGLLLTRRFWR